VQQVSVGGVVGAMGAVPLFKVEGLGPVCLKPRGGLKDEDGERTGPGGLDKGKGGLGAATWAVIHKATEDCESLNISIHAQIKKIHHTATKTVIISGWKLEMVQVVESQLVAQVAHQEQVVLVDHMPLCDL